jgi:hypothetical protein
MVIIVRLATIWLCANGAVIERQNAIRKQALPFISEDYRRLVFKNHARQPKNRTANQN